MNLISFSVEKYRSITTARKIPVQSYTLLIGPHNEGNSNILHALRLGINTIVSWRDFVVRMADGRTVRRPPRVYRSDYDWERDFPIRLQDKHPESSSNVTLEFELSELEVLQFREDVGSALNGTLPIQLSFGRSGQLDVSIAKQGRGQSTLNKKVNRIASFVSDRIKFDYIPAIRTASSASQVISRLVEVELAALEQQQAYREAVSRIEALQAPILRELGASIRGTIEGFLPNVTEVVLKPEADSRYRALRRNVEIMINDGEMTPLSRKGDGVQSLVALALMRHASDRQAEIGNSIIAIEEPESHLHPDAIHELRVVIHDLSIKNQIVITTHSPLFVNRENVHSNVVVHRNRARAARNVKEIRDILGVRFSDNLQNALLVVLVEGSEDARALRACVVG